MAYRLRIDLVRPGMKLSQPIYDRDGKLLLKSGTELSNAQIKKLKSSMFRSLPVDTGFGLAVEKDEALSEESRLRAVLEVRDFLCSTQQEKKVRSLKKIEQLANDMVDEIIANIRFPCSLPQLGLVNEYLSLHSVDVGVSSVLAGAALGYARKKLVRIAMCGFLHDIGKLKVDRRFLEKPGPLSPGEFEEVKRHTFYASELGICEDDVLRTAMQHHERYDGRGYPQGLSGEEIAEFSRIAKIADVFNAMTTDRVYRFSVLAGEALNYIREGAGTEFDAKIVRIFCRAFAFYPAGTLVRLPEGEVGVVTKNHPEAPLQPVVVLLFDKNGRAIDSREVDLLKSKSGEVKIICHSEVAGLLSKKRDLGRWFC